MRAILMLLTGAALLVSQPTVIKNVTMQPGKVTEIVLSVASPQAGDAFDILSSSPSAAVSIRLPNGTELAANEQREDAPVLTVLSATESNADEADQVLKKVLVSGPGKHWLLAFRDRSPEGTYRIRVDGSSTATSFRVRVSAINMAGLLKAMFQKVPSTRIFEHVKVPAGSKGARISFTLGDSIGPAIVDVIPTDPRTSIRLLLPDGTQVTPENAKRHSVEWSEQVWPPKATDDELGFVALTLAASMLPTPGVHQLMYFSSETPPKGKFTIEAIAPGKQNTLVSAMVTRLGDLEQVGVKSGETRAIGFDSYPLSFVGDKIELKFRLQGEPVRQPLAYHSHVKVTRLREASRELDTRIDFVPDTNGLYRGIFVPNEAGLYQFSVDIEGRQKSGHSFVTTAEMGALEIHPSVARVTGLTERAVITEGAVRPHRLEVAASIDVFVPGEYEFSAVLRDNSIARLTQSRKVILERGSQQISASFRASQITRRFDSGGPYHVSITLDQVVEHGVKNTADLRAASDLTTAAYRLEDWEPIGKGLDLKGNGKFQVYRVYWDVVTQGGDCSWQVGFDPDKSGPISAQVIGHAHLSPGPTTLESDVDGYWIASVGGAHAWWINIWNFKCDGKDIPKTEDPLALMLKTPMLRPEDFEARPVDFHIESDVAEVRLSPGGRQRAITVDVEPVGQLRDSVVFQVKGAPSFIKIAPTNPYNSPLLRRGYLNLYASDAAPPGTYPIQLIATAAGLEHGLPLRVIVDAPSPAAPLPPPPPSIDTAPPQGLVQRAKKVGLKRRSVAIIATSGGGMGQFGCDLMKRMTREITDQLQFGRDVVSIIETGTSVNMAMPMTTNFAAVLPNVLQDLSTVRCEGTPNAVYAMENAGKQLQTPDLQNTERSVVLLMSALPGAITANWPVRTQSEARKTQFRGEIKNPPSGCADLQGRHYPDPGWATGDSMPERSGVLRIATAYLVGPLMPADHVSPDLTPDSPTEKDCAFTAGPNLATMNRDLAYLPETDWNGVPVEGARPLLRFEQGPYRGKIRPDLSENVLAMQWNLLTNELQLLRGAGIRVVLAWMNRSKDPEGLEGFVDDLITIHDEEQIPHAIEEISNAISGGTLRK